jgi:transposase
VTLHLTAGQVSDVTQAEALLEGTAPEVVIADKGYDSQAVVDLIRRKGAEAVIPTRKNHLLPRVIDSDRYKDRNLAERFWAKMKQYRRVATRYEKTARNFLGFVHLASIMLLLQ